MKVLILGASGMIGSTTFKVLRQSGTLDVWGTLRSSYDRSLFSQTDALKLIDGVELTHSDLLPRLYSNLKPDVVVNCAGLTKHRAEANDPIQNIELNSILPHRLAGLCKLAGARLVHVSTDCVFQGDKGGYVESDSPDARDFYGRSKSMGEIICSPHVITLRTSTIGHELKTRYGLLEWFLSLDDNCVGFSRAIFSGLPTVVFAQIIRDFVLPRTDLHGLYHVAAKPISKLDLLKTIARVYKRQIDIIPDGNTVIDRSLDGTQFSKATNFFAPDWEELIYCMYAQQRNMSNV